MESLEKNILVSGMTIGMRGFVCSPNSYIYFNLGLYDSALITCKGYRAGAVVDIKFDIATASNFIHRSTEGNLDIPLYKKDNSFCVYIPDNTNIFISFSWKTNVEISNVLHEGYSLLSF